MKRIVSACCLVVLLVSAVTALASEPRIAGQIAGTELCPQFICGVAAFTGDFQGKVGGKGAKGTFLVQVNHDDLPGVGGTADITDGSFILNTTRGTFLGGLTGTLTNVGNDLFQVDATLTVTTGGLGDIRLRAILNHQGLPFVIPTISGELFQP